MFFSNAIHIRGISGLYRISSRALLWCNAPAIVDADTRGQKNKCW